MPHFFDQQPVTLAQSLRKLGLTAGLGSHFLFSGDFKTEQPWSRRTFHAVDHQCSLAVTGQVNDW
jgi:hypothetical protein